MRHDQLTLAQETIGYIDSFLDQPTGIVAQIQNHAVNGAFRKARQRLIHFVASSFVESLDAHVRDPGPNPKRIIYRASRDVVADNGEMQWLRISQALHRDG